MQKGEGTTPCPWHPPGGTTAPMQRQRLITFLLVPCFHIFLPVPLALRTKHWDPESRAFRLPHTAIWCRDLHETLVLSHSITPKGERTTSVRLSYIFYPPITNTDKHQTPSNFRPQIKPFFLFCFRTPSSLPGPFT